MKFIKSKIDYILVICVYLFYYFYSVNTIPELVIPAQGTDPFTFDIIADIISKKGLLLNGLGTYFFTVVYGYFIFLLKTISTANIVVFSKLLIFLQMSIFIVSGYFFKKLTGVMFNNSCSRIGYYAYCLYPPFIYQSMLPVKDILTISIIVFCLYNFVCFRRDGNIKNAIFCGLFLGIAINFRGNFAFILPLFLFEVLKKTDFKALFLFFCCVFISILPFTFRNIIVAKDTVLLSSVGGIHLYIGNHYNALGIYTFVKDIRPSTFGHYYDAKKVAEKELGRKLKDSEVNRFWKNKAVYFVKSYPYKALKLIGKKLMLALNYYEVPNNYSFYFFAGLNLPFKALSCIPYQFGVLFVLGCLGFIFSRFKHKCFFVSCFVVLFISSASIFITGRYRLPLVVFLMVGLISFIDGILSKNIKLNNFKPKTIYMLFCVLALCLITFYPVFTLKKEFMSIYQKKHDYANHMWRVYKSIGSDKFNDGYYRIKKQYVSYFTKEEFL